MKEVTNLFLTKGLLRSVINQRMNQRHNIPMAKCMRTLVISVTTIPDTFMLRQFHVESFVIQYRIDSISADKRTIVFISESIENIPSGYRAKETYRLISDNEIEETFEIAEPNKEFAAYSKVKLVRQK